MIDPVLYSFNAFQIRIFGCLVAFGLLLDYVLIRRNLREAKIRLSRDELLDWLIIVFLYGVIGGRCGYVLLHWGYYFGPSSRWYEFMAIWRGGLDLNSGLIFAFGALWLLNKDRKPYLEQITDQIVPPLFLLLALARLGNFINGEYYGRVTEEITGYTYIYGPASKLFTAELIHPLALYEVVLCLIGFLGLNVLRKGRFRNGMTTACALFWYSGMQLGAGVLREDGSQLFLMDESRLVGIVGLMISAGVIFGKRLYRKLPSPHEQFPSTRKWSV